MRWNCFLFFFLSYCDFAVNVENVLNTNDGYLKNADSEKFHYNNIFIGNILYIEICMK